MSFVENILGRAEETMPVVRPRPRSRFEEQAPGSNDTSDIGASSEDPIAARPPAPGRMDALDAPDAPGQLSTAEQEPAPATASKPLSIPPTPADAPAGPMRETHIERLEPVVETRLSQDRADSPAPGGRRTPSHADPVQATQRIAPIQTHANERPQPESATAPVPASVETRIETVLRTVRTEVERERIVERIVTGPSMAEGQPEQSATPVVNATPPGVEQRPQPEPADARRPNRVTPAAIAPTAPVLAPAPAVEASEYDGHERVLHVSIGQLEIRATRSGGPDRKRGTEVQREPAAPRLTLEEYLRERNGGAS